MLIPRKNTLIGSNMSIGYKWAQINPKLVTV
jgi:hypothetical protein